MNLVDLAKNIYNHKKNRKIVNSKFKTNHDFDKRWNESQRIVIKYPERVPIICERFTTNVPEVDRKKYLCPRDLSLANFIYVIRKRMTLNSEKALYLFVNNKMIPCSKLLGTIYEQEKDEDGFLYINYGGESTFG